MIPQLVFSMNIKNMSDLLAVRADAIPSLISAAMFIYSMILFALRPAGVNRKFHDNPAAARYNRVRKQPERQR